MLLLFRQLKSSIKDGSFRKYTFIAIGELILVVLGILIAFQLENLREEHQKRQSEKEIIKQIHADFIYNEEQFLKTTAGHQNVKNSVDWILKELPLKESKQPRDSIKKYLAGTFLAITFDPAQTSIESLINNPTFDLITNDSLRFYINRWKDVVEDYNEEEIGGQNTFYTRYTQYFIESIPLTQIVGPDSLQNMDALSTVEFENLVRERGIATQYVLGEKGLVEHLLKRILELTKE